LDRHQALPAGGAEAQLPEVEDKDGVFLLALFEQLARAFVVFGGMLAGEFLRRGRGGDGALRQHGAAPKRRNDSGD
jgi:hypothetical protein